MTRAGDWRLPERGPFREVAHAWIPMADGTRLSARLWIPDGAPAPAVLEYIPYRTRDGYRFHDDLWGAELASYGIAYARVDVRGSGESEGVLTDEYLPIELEDGCACIAWLAAQDWCSGAVGMRGLSWGGINTLQVAAMNPPALRAIMPMCCMDNRYTDDAHYIGGALGHANLQWGIAFKAVMAGPPDPEVVGEAWEAMWQARLEATPPIIGRWLEHQREDAYWRRGSIDADWGAIRVPTYLVGGWQDTYVTALGHLLTHLNVPKKALIGPWGHNYPYLAQPLGLAWTQEEVRWWAHWLTGTETGIMDGPTVAAFMPYAAPSAVIPADIPGRWVTETAWPPVTQDQVLHLNAGGLSSQAGAAGIAKVAGDRVVGVTKPEWLDRPPVEQSVDDARTLVFDSDPLSEDVEILGVPVLRVRLAADQLVAQLAARLTEVTAEGQSWLVSWGLLNLTHRASHAAPTPLEPGEAYDVELPLAMIAHRFGRGSRIRLAISEGLWPMAWPSPQVATLSLTLGAVSRLTLPVRARESEPAQLDVPETHSARAGPRPTAVMEPVAPGRYRIENDSPPAPYHLKANGMTLSRGRWETSEIREGDPASCRWTQRAVSRWSREGWDCEVEARCALTADAERFAITETLTARRGGAVIFRRRSRRRIRRELL